MSAQPTFLSQFASALAALVGYAPSMREQLDGRLL
jgi:hypothetical protein